MRRLEQYLAVGQRRLRCGYTTGTCAAAAARAAAELLLLGAAPDAVLVETPAGVPVAVEVEECARGAGWAQCAVRKDAGDDPDVTDGIFVVARVERSAKPGIGIRGGEGVGRVTLPGLDQPVGEAAVNSTPRRMIAAEVEAVRALAGARREDNLAGNPATGAGGAERGLLVTVSVPGGAELAQRTFNPRLGVQGGISIIGTSGIVKPMSEEALISSLELELGTLAAQGLRDVLVVPGNYGRDFARDVLGLSVERALQCSNYLGAVIDAAVRLGFARMLVVGHLGKMAKVAGGIMNTHSRVADARREVLAAHAALAGAPVPVVRSIMEAATTDAGLDALAACGLLEDASASLVRALQGHLAHRAGAGLQVEAIVFSNQHGLLGTTEGAWELARVWQEDGQGHFRAASALSGQEVDG